MKEENITNEELLSFIKEGFSNIEGKMATKEEMNEGFRDIRMDIKQLQEGAFSKAEKENILGVVKHFDKQLENDVLGKENITLLREEYDSVATTVGFANRFEKIGK